jgi:hypothetical protein
VSADQPPDIRFSVGSVRSVGIEDPKECWNVRVKQPDLVLTKERQEILRFLIRYDEFDFDCLGPRELEEPALVQDVVTTEPGHRPERRAATNAVLAGLLQEPLPH